ncbi:MAG: DUF3854 domain-containing protein [Gloeomargaritaceae cyanobacterium C42_A2020_066]|nr:DUF3854 domain-containing protein [Gloeomargaritaceae cyanobacterium C42_A2020_066]
MARAGCDVHVCNWDKNFKGIDDYLAAHPGEDVHEFVEFADPFKEWASDARELDREQ